MATEEQGAGNTKSQCENSNVKLCLQNSSLAGEMREGRNYCHIKRTENQDKVSKENHIAHAICLNANKIVLVVALAIRRLFSNTFLNTYVKEAHTAWNIFIKQLLTSKLFIFT